MRKRTGELLYIRDVKMKPQYRQKGLACLALKYLLRKLSQRQSNASIPSNGEEWWFAGELLPHQHQLHS